MEFAETTHLSPTRSKMDASNQDPNPEVGRLDEPELDLYTIPSYSSWFSWDDIHETERLGLKEFFDGSSISRTPKIYKEYRDFIINKFREDPSRRLTFTDIRKSLVGDVSLLHKVFTFLEKWGLINFGLATGGDGIENDERVRFEDGAPNGVRVLATPNSLRPITVPAVADLGRGSVENGVKYPPLASYSDAFGDLKRLRCGNCREECNSSGYYEYSQGNFIICAKCYGSGNYGENKSKDDFKFNDTSRNKDGHRVVWTEAETLLLLDSVLKHGDDWELVAQNVQTKSKLECISKLIEMPFGEHLMGSAQGMGGSNGAIATVNNVNQFSDSSPKHQEIIETGSGSSGPSVNIDEVKDVSDSSSPHQETIKTENEDQYQKQSDEEEQNGDAENQGPPSKKQCIAVLPAAGNSLMKQVALMSTMVEPHITAAAAEAAVTAICEETLFPKEIFDGDVDTSADGLQSPSQLNKLERDHHDQGTEMKDASTLLETRDAPVKEDEVPTPLRIRAAAATGLGAAAAHAKLLAAQERREIENLVATIIEAQLKKLHSKVKHLDELEAMMDKERSVMEELKEYIIEEWIDVLRTGLDTGVSRWRDHGSSKPQTGNAA